MKNSKLKKELRAELLKRMTVPPGKKLSLKKDFPCDWSPKGLSKEKAADMLQQGVQWLAELQDKLYAQDKHALLIIFQAMDAAGKDGTIKHVMSGVNPQGCQVFSFKAPSNEELDHDYLWRCTKALPERGRIGIFNRSYYEEVLVARVHPEILQRQRLPPDSIGKDIWKRRYEQIRNFEKYLVENGIHIVKIFLNVSKKEQKKRFLDRIEEADKNWKFSINDAKERNYWDKYQEAYADCLTHTSTKWAPWYVVPADFKPFSRLAVGFLIFEKLRSLRLTYPIVTDEHRAELMKVKSLLESESD